MKFYLLIFLGILFLSSGSHVHARNNPRCITENNNHAVEKFLRTIDNADHNFAAILAESAPLEASTCISDQVLYHIILAKGSAKTEDRINAVSTKHFDLSIKKAEESRNGPLMIFSKLQYAYYLYHYRNYQLLLPQLIEVMELAEQTDHDKILLPADSFTKMGWILQSLGKQEESIRYLTIAQRYVNPNSTEAAGLLDNIGTAYLNKNDLVKAQQFFEQSISLSTRINDHIRSAKAMGNLAQVHQKKGNISEAVRLLMKDIEISEQYRADQNTMFASILLAELLTAQNDLKSAQIYIDKAYRISSSKTYFQSSLLQVLNVKLKMAMQKKDSINELEIRRHISELENELKNTDSPDGVKEARWKLQEKELSLKIKKAQTKSDQDMKIKAILLFLAGVAAFMAILILFKSRAEKIGKQRQLDQAAEKYRQEKEAQEQNFSKLQASLHEQIEFLKNKTSQITILQDELKMLRQQNSSTADPAHQNLAKILQTHLMTEENWLNFRNEFRKVHQDFYHKIITDFPEITESNLRIILLSKLRFNNSEIAGLLGVTPDAVKKSKSRLRKKLGEKHQILDSYLQMEKR